MKQLEIKTHPTTVLPDGEKFSTKTLIYTALNSVPKEGFHEDDDAKRERIRSIVREHDAGNPILLLEDADHSVLLGIVNDMRDKKASAWPFSDPMIKEFCNDLRAAKSVKPAQLQDLTPSENGKHKGKMEKVK